MEYVARTTTPPPTNIKEFCSELLNHHFSDRNTHQDLQLQLHLNLLTIQYSQPHHSTYTRPIIDTHGLLKQHGDYSWGSSQIHHFLFQSLTLFWKFPVHHHNFFSFGYSFKSKMYRQWSRHFFRPRILHDAFPLDGMTRFLFICENFDVLKKDLESPLTFVLFLKRKTK